MAMPLAAAAAAAVRRSRCTAAAPSPSLRLPIALAATPSGADSRHIAYWRDNGMPVPAGTKVKVKVLTYIGHPTLPAIAQGAKHVILNNMPSWPVPIATACQATVM